MSVAERVAEHLPYLRRFARATTGSQKSGDAYVVLTLEAILEDPSIISDDLSARVGLYRVFAKVLNSIEWTGEKKGEAPAPVLEGLSRVVGICDRRCGRRPGRYRLAPPVAPGRGRGLRERHRDPV